MNRVLVDGNVRSICSRTIRLGGWAASTITALKPVSDLIIKGECRRTSTSGRSEARRAVEPRR
ncbi:MAG: hypothetical protein AB1651_19950, partial [Pseudomonadota bacterium]